MTWERYEKTFTPGSLLQQAVINNTELPASETKSYDDIQFLLDFAKKYENRNLRQLDQYRNYQDLHDFETIYKNLPIVKRAQGKIEHDFDRFILYDCCADLVRGYSTGLAHTISDLYDDPDRLDVSKSMIEETHPLFTDGFLEFETKGSLSESTICLTTKAKKCCLMIKPFYLKRI